MAAHARGVELSPGHRILFELSSYFTSDEEVIGLATFLLENVGQGGFAFVKSLSSQPTLTLKAHAILEEWVTKKPDEAFGKRLWSVLSEKTVKPTAAKDFKEKLLGVTDSSGITAEKRSRTAFIDDEGEPAKKFRKPPASEHKRRMLVTLRQDGDLNAHGVRVSNEELLARCTDLEIELNRTRQQLYTLQVEYNSELSKAESLREKLRLSDAGLKSLQDRVAELEAKEMEKPKESEEPQAKPTFSFKKTEVYFGVELKPGSPYFQDISRRFTKIDDVYKLADVLWEDFEPGDGRDWVNALTKAGGMPFPSDKALAVFEQWFEQSPHRPDGTHLWRALCKVRPRVAEDFKESLVFNFFKGGF